MTEPSLVPVSPEMVEAAASAHAQCRSLRFALRAYSGLEKLLAEDHLLSVPASPIERGEIAALVALINEEVERRFADMAEAAEVLRETGERSFSAISP